MDLREIIEAFQNGLARVCLWALAACAVGYVGLWLYRSTASAMRSLGAWGRITVFAFFSSVCVLLVGGKARSGGALGERALPVAATSAAASEQMVTEEEIARGWREAAETNCTMDVYTMPDGVSPSFNWHRRGTFGEWARLDLGGFSFPIGTNDEAVTSFSVFNDGRIRPRPRDAAREIRAVGVPMLALQGASRFWVADAAAADAPWARPYRSKLLTWENFFLNADTNAPVNAQIELFPNGDFITRSNDVERIYRRVYPFDYDGDGLENSVDPDPLVAGSDAHGTNAEWYNTVCSNVLDAVATSCAPPGSGAGGTQLVESVELSWREGVNSNAYYLVDVVVSNGPAPIFFTGDRDSRLGNPVIVALGGATNRVPLLIGIDYAITSPVPFTVSYPMEYMYPILETNELCRAHIRWPLEFTIAPDGFGGYVVGTFPYDPGCTFQWGLDGSGGGLRSMPIAGSSCAYSTSGNWISFNCGGNGDCGCHGCSVSGCAVLEYAFFEIPSIWCGCWYPDPDEPGNGSVVTNVPSVSVSFDKAVLFYEDAYTNAPNDVVAKHSTNTTLTVFASGGDTGGMLYVSEQNIRKLVRVDGDTITFPYAAFIPPDGGMSFSIEYEAETHSDSQNDIVVTATLQPVEGVMSCTASTATTVAKISIEAEANFPTNKRRHVFGPAERVLYSITPLGVSFTLQGDVPFHGMHDHLQGVIVMPFCAAQFSLMAINGDTSLSLPFTVIEPEADLSIDSVTLPSDDDWKNVMNATPLQEGDIGSVFHVNMSLKPSYVSFDALGIMELYAAATNVQGFFTNAVFNGHLNHGIEAGAFRPTSVNEDNTVGTGDNVLFTLNNAFLPYLKHGTFKLDIPVVWYVEDESFTNSLAVLEVRNTIYGNADVTASKYAISVTRGTNNLYTISR